jgi:L-alanine-DL-glutamate epimerase-like enolase superfamily enzyme
MKITRINLYRPRKLNPTFNQSDWVVTVETDEGITGIGEGGTPDTLTQCAAMLIGEDPARIQHLWQFLYRGFFYPAGREKLHALGALDLALWDIKGKALGVPVHALLGGRTRDHVECYSTACPRQDARSCGVLLDRLSAAGHSGGDCAGLYRGRIPRLPNDHRGIRRRHLRCAPHGRCDRRAVPRGT